MIKKITKDYNPPKDGSSRYAGSSRVPTTLPPKVGPSTTLAEILEKPELVEILVKYNLPCLSCPFAKMEMENLKIGEICKMYSLDVNNLLKELNRIYPRT